MIFIFIFTLLLLLGAPEVEPVPCNTGPVGTVPPGAHDAGYGLYWIDASRANATLIEHKVEGGRETDGELLYICRNHMPNTPLPHTYPGKFSPSRATCSAVGWNRDWIFAQFYQILVNPLNICLKWVPWDGLTHGETFPSNAIFGGYRPRFEAGQVLYNIARTKSDISLQPGKASTWGMFYFDDIRPGPTKSEWSRTDGKSENIARKNYEILTADIPPCNTVPVGKVPPGAHPAGYGLYWVDASAQNHTWILNKVEGGKETNGEPLYVCRNIDFENRQYRYVGKFTSTLGTCTSTSLDSDWNSAANFQILINPTNICLNWVPWDGVSHKFKYPPNVVEGGLQPEYGKLVEYNIARKKLDNSVQIGKANRWAIWYFTDPKAPISSEKTDTWREETPPTWEVDRLEYEILCAA